MSLLLTTDSKGNNSKIVLYPIVLCLVFLSVNHLSTNYPTVWIIYRKCFLWQFIRLFVNAKMDVYSNKNLVYIWSLYELIEIFSGVESAGVPSGLQTLADKIKLQPSFQDNFVQTSSKQAEAWLRQTLSEDLKQFLSHFGHRCLKEFEFVSSPWGQDLSPVVTTLQAILSDAALNNVREIKVCQKTDGRLK